MEQAVKKGDLKEVRCLLDTGTILTEATDVETLYSLHLACDYGHFPIAKFLIERGNPVDILDASLSTPFYFASKKGYLALVKLLLENGASLKMRASNRTPASDWKTKITVSFH